jgi:hypothetical protein
MTAPLRFGAFFAPFHPVGQDPTLARTQDWSTGKRAEISGQAGEAIAPTARRAG